LQIRHKKRLTAKFLFPKGLAACEEERPQADIRLRPSSTLSSILSDGAKLLCHSNSLDWRGDLQIWGLTGFEEFRHAAPRIFFA
jgi:hypothetical protein